MPFVGNGLATIESECAARLLGAEKGPDVLEVGRGGVAVLEVGEEAEEEGGGAVEQDYFGAIVEVCVLRDGLVVALAHEFDHVREAEGAACGGVHHVEEGAVEGVVVWGVEEKVGARERGVGFEFLWGWDVS